MECIRKNPSCCGTPCPSVTCYISGTTLNYTISGATSAIIKKWCGDVLTTTTITPTNGSGTVTGIDLTCVYFIVANNSSCEVTKSCEDPSCTCAGRDGYLIIDLVHTPGSLFTIDTSGTYYGAIGGVGCLWTITRNTTDACSQWQLRRQSVPFVGIRLVFVVLISCSSTQTVKVFNADYCSVDDTYTFGPFFDGSVFVFTIRGV